MVASRARPFNFAASGGRRKKGQALELIRFILASAGPFQNRLVGAMALTSLGMGALMVVVNLASAPDADGEALFGLVVLFVCLAALVIGGHRYSTRLTTTLAEAVLRELRDDAVRLVRRLELDGLERTGVERIHATVARDSVMISDAMPVVMTGVISGFTFVLLGAYIAWLSLFGALILGCVLAVTVYFYRYSQRHSRAALVAASSQETAFLEQFGHLLHGFKEVRQNAPRGEDLEGGHLLPASALIEARNAAAAERIASGMSVSYIGFYALLAATVFLLPGYAEEHATVLQVLYAVLFMLSSLDNVLRSLAVLQRADLAMSRLRDMTATLRGLAGAEEPDARLPRRGFSEIELHGVAYSYRGSDGKATFTVGPCDLVLTPGEIVFLVGGNGSGKSTLSKLVTGLYEPSSGMIAWDGREVGRAERGEYRQLFSCVFTDFHLFDRLYGLDVPEQEVNALIAEMGLAEKTAYRDGRFTRLDLSTGQRKRLALVVALLEDRPAYLLDEVGADQDPPFRARFYNEILPGLRARGKAVIVISHDDRYFGVADRIFTMQDGRLAETAVPA